MHGEHGEIPGVGAGGGAGPMVCEEGVGGGDGGEVGGGGGAWGGEVVC